MYIRQKSYVVGPDPKGEAATRTARIPASASDVIRAAVALVLSLAPLAGAAEKFVPFGEQPDGSQIFVQAAPAAERKDGKLQGWFRTVPKDPAPVTDSFGFERKYREMLALNVADCFNRRMGTQMMAYRDAQGADVARFDAAGAIEYRDVKAGTLGESMFTWLCSPRPRSAAPPSAAGAPSPFK